jgi:hypothetical protein
LSAGFRPLGQLRDADTKTAAQPNNVAPARITPTVLDVADPGLDEAHGLCNLRLAQAAFFTDGAHRFAEGELVGRMTYRHGLLRFALTTPISLRTKQGQRFKAQPLSDTLDGLECQVTLAPLNTAHVGAVDAEHIGECLLAQFPGFAVGPQVPANGSL